VGDVVDGMRIHGSGGGRKVAKRVMATFSNVSI